MHAQIHTIASCSIETIASMVQIRTASGSPAMAIVELPLRQNGSRLTWHWPMGKKRNIF